MKCIVCGSTMDTKRENIRYDASGLPYVTLQQVEVSRCPQCGEVEIALPRIDELHRVIAAALIAKPSRLDAAEIRYLRKYLGWSGADFAAHMGTTRETVSRWEHGAVAMGPQADRLLRLMVATKAPVQDYAVETLKAISPTKSPRAFRLGVKVARYGWQAAAA
jgi:putative zinc finger/helix-turn-helix YgiT family protein